jgi:hypothetical protein
MADKELRKVIGDMNPTANTDGFLPINTIDASTTNKINLKGVLTPFTEHIEDEEIHVSIEDRIKWDAGGSGGGSVDSVNNFRPDLAKNVQAQVPITKEALLLLQSQGKLKEGQIYVTNEDYTIEDEDTITKNALGKLKLSSPLLDIINNKQSKLVSGTNIKTINSQSILGDGDIEIASVYRMDLLNIFPNYIAALINDGETIVCLLSESCEGTPVNNIMSGIIMRANDSISYNISDSITGINYTAYQGLDDTSIAWKHDAIESVDTCYISNSVSSDIEDGSILNPYHSISNAEEARSGASYVVFNFFRGGDSFDETIQHVDTSDRKTAITYRADQNVQVRGGAVLNFRMDNVTFEGLTLGDTGYNSLTVELISITKLLLFKNCTFAGDIIFQDTEYEDTDVKVVFDNCTFESKVVFTSLGKNCNVTFIKPIFGMSYLEINDANCKVIIDGGTDVSLKLRAFNTCDIINSVYGTLTPSITFDYDCLHYKDNLYQCEALGIVYVSSGTPFLFDDVYSDPSFQNKIGTIVGIDTPNITVGVPQDEYGLIVQATSGDLNLNGFISKDVPIYIEDGINLFLGCGIIETNGSRIPMDTTVFSPGIYANDNGTIITLQDIVGNR